MATATQVSPHLVRSAISAALFFLPLGIVAVVYSVRCHRALEGAPGSDPNTEGALKDSRLAYRWSTAAIVVGIVIYAVLALAFLLLGAFT